MADGAFYRSNPNSGGDGTIYWQEKPNTVMVPISPLQWDAYSNNGNKYVDYSGDDIAELLTQFGEIPAPNVL